MPTKIHTLIATTQIFLERRKSCPDPAGIQIRRALARLSPLPPLSGWFPKNSHPATAYVGAALKNGTDATAALLDVITPVIRHLPWQHGLPNPEDVPGLEQRAAAAELIGPEAPFRNRAVRLGFALIAPSTHCPAHHHFAAELFCVITGTASWIQDGVSHPIPPGAIVLNPPQSVHAVCTSADAVLALYLQISDDASDVPEYSI